MEQPIVDEILNELVTSNKILNGIIAELDAMDAESTTIETPAELPVVMIGQGCYLKPIL